MGVPEYRDHITKFLFDVVTPERYAQRPKFFDLLLKAPVFDIRQQRGGWTLVMNVVWKASSGLPGDNEDDHAERDSQLKQIKLLKTLIDMGVDHTRPNYSGESPAAVARSCGKEGITNFLEGLATPSSKRRKISG